MTRMLEIAIEALHRQPESVQDEVGTRILDYVERLDSLKVEIKKGLDDVAAGRYRELTDEVWDEIRLRAEGDLDRT